MLVLEPYYGGSHKSFLSGLQALPFDFQLMALPARKWKWRMRLAAPLFADMLRQGGKTYDRVLCSTFVDVATLRGLGPAWLHNTPVLVYYHENQFAYPVQSKDERDIHFAMTNFTTALSADSLAFNSRYNLNTFLEGSAQFLRQAPDMKFKNIRASIESKSRVLSPGVDFGVIDEQDRVLLREHTGSPVILWNHRWEHDKNPERFFRVLFKLDEKGVDFRLVVLGESFKNQPAIFDEARRRLGHRWLQFGYVKSRREYARWLLRSDIVVSTSGHEFFGISVIEAVRAGCRPLLPNRLSYPELFPPEFLYEEKSFQVKLRKAIRKNKRLAPEEARSLTEHFSWEALLPEYEAWIRDPNK